MSGSAVNKEGAKKAGAAADAASAYGSNLGGRASGIESTLEPTLLSDINNPQGYGTAGLAQMNTAAQQSAGGSTAGAVGSGFRRAARTGNAGGFDAAAAEVARSGQREAGQRAVEIAGSNERLKQEQRSNAIKGLEGLYGEDLGGSLKAMGLVPEDIKAQTEASKKQGGLLQTLGQLNQMAATDAALA